jgi:hypothetical protein
MAYGNAADAWRVVADLRAAPGIHAIRVIRREVVETVIEEV